MIIYAFSNGGKALKASQDRYINYVKALFAKGDPIINGGEFIKTLKGKPPAQILILKICGRRNKKIIKTFGLTKGNEGYVQRIKAYQNPEWYLPKLNGEYMEGITGYTEMELPKNWKYPVPLPEDGVLDINLKS